MAQRKKLLDSLSLTEDHTIMSEIYVFEPEGLACTKEITVELPLMSLAGSAKDQMVIKVKVDDSWEEIKVFEKVKLSVHTYT